MSKELEKMTKKELKDYVNQNGFFFHIQCDKISTDEVQAILTDATQANLVQTGREVPKGDNIVVFKGIASQNYAKGDKSRNGYKYDQNGWDFSAYLGNPIILWQHESQYGGIGNAIAFWNDKAGNLCTMFFVDLDTLEERNAVQVKRGYVTAISTGAIAKEYMFEENDTGTMYSEQDAEEKFGWENVWEAYFGCSEILTLVVTAAEMIENSLVTIGSNEKAVAMQNAIGSHFQKYADTYKKSKMQTNDAKVETTTPSETKTDAKNDVVHCDSCRQNDCEGCTPAEGDGEPTHCQGCESDACKGQKMNNSTDSDESKQDNPTTDSTTEDVAKSEETPTPAEQSGDETKDDQKPADENEAKLADALEKIATLESTISELKTSHDAFKDEVYETMSEFIKSHNDAVDNLGQINTALGSMRISKGLPHIRGNAVVSKQSPLLDALRQIKGE